MTIGTHIEMYMPNMEVIVNLIDTEMMTQKEVMATEIPHTVVEVMIPKEKNR